MTRLPDFLYVALFALAWPIYDYLVLWPAFLRRAAHDPERARWRMWRNTFMQEWLLVAVGVLLFLTFHRPLVALGFKTSTGWRLWASAAFLTGVAANYLYTARRVARSAKAQASVRRQLGQLSLLLPHTRRELRGFAVLSLTAGFCEEFLFRGYFIWTLAPVLSWWGAAALSALVFGLAHAYQGRLGIVRTTIVGVAFVAVYAIFDSLYPAIALHALIDLAAGLLAWQALRARDAPGAA
jgi:membrane protease YdiL (CAAX protease family)